jgi:NADPH-dependent 2,4-dienoyl-CoA reductase/sulfur reductase-like enzyme
MLHRIVVVGASLAGLRAAETLRDRGFGGKLTLIGDEPHRPYDRPPLSKQVLQGTWEPDQTFFRKKDGYDALALDMRLGVRATSLDLRAGRVALADGTFADYDRLIIATGARVRTLTAIAPRAGLLTLRGLDDAIVLRRALMDAPRVAIVGAGFIGLEVAASCRARGLPVTVIESLPVPLSPILGPTLGAMVAAMHRDHGVDLRTGVTVTNVVGGSHAGGIVLSDGSRIDADVVVVGIGVTPNTEWLDGSGLTLDNGIVCNGFGEAAPDVYAAGDVARVANRWHGDSPRIEHWTNAVEQAVHAAQNALAGPEASTSFSSVPYFWSDEYDRKIQFVGRARPHDEMAIVDGSLADRRLTALYRRGDRVVACLAVNQPRALIHYRKLLAAGASWEAALQLLRTSSAPG